MVYQMVYHDCNHILRKRICQEAHFFALEIKKIVPPVLIRCHAARAAIRDAEMRMRRDIPVARGSFFYCQAPFFSLDL